MLSVVNCDLVGEDNLVLGELLVEGVLGQGHHLQYKQPTSDSEYYQNCLIVENLRILVTLHQTPI